MSEDHDSAPNKADTDRPLDLEAGRRAFIWSLGLGAGMLGTMTAEAPAATPDLDVAILNFALNLEYVEAEFHLRAAFGRGLSDSEITGQGTLGGVTGGRQVNFTSKLVRAFAEEIAVDEEGHVNFLRSTLGSQAVARPAVNLQSSFVMAARAAGAIGPNESFDPYANDLNFLLATYNFVDLGVTAFIGSAPLITNKAYLGAASGILATEGYHAGLVRSYLFAEQNPVAMQTTASISALHRVLSGAKDDQGIGGDQSTMNGGNLTPANIVPTDPNSVAFARTPRQVANIVYNAAGASRGGFFPAGMNAGPGGQQLLSL